MRVLLLCIGKTNQDFVQSGIDFFIKRLKRYCQFEIVVLPDVKNPAKYSPDQLKEKEAQAFQKYIGNKAYWVLDEKGKQYRSIKFADFLEKQAVNGNSEFIFCIGGAFGFDKDFKRKATGSLSLSEMTFTHQFIRLMFIEQLYRAFTILKNEPYHNE